MHPSQGNRDAETLQLPFVTISKPELKCIVCRSHHTAMVIWLRTFAESIVSIPARLQVDPIESSWEAACLT